MAFKRILCAVDFSPGARVALQVACDLARSSKALLVIAHVIETRMWLADTLLELASPARVAETDRVERELATWRDEAKRMGAGEVKTEIVEGVTAWDRIVETARDERIDLIVLGSHGRTGFSRALIGSVAENVVRHAHSPVLVVPARPKQ